MSYQGIPENKRGQHDYNTPVTLGADRVSESWVSQKLIHQTDHNEEYNHDSQLTT